MYVHTRTDVPTGTMALRERCTAGTAEPQAEYGGKLSIVTYIIVTTYFPAYSKAHDMVIYCLGRIFFISLGIIITMAASVVVFPRWVGMWVQGLGHSGFGPRV